MSCPIDQVEIMRKKHLMLVAISISILIAIVVTKMQDVWTLNDGINLCVRMIEGLDEMS